MTAITHHASDSLLAAYATGTLPQPYALVVASHVSLCLECRAAYDAHQEAGGVVLDGIATETVSDGLRSRVIDLLDVPGTDDGPGAAHGRSGVFPGPVMEALSGRAPRWKPLGMGVRQCILSSDNDGSARLLFIPPGQAVPDHSHNGLELTLVLQGNFSDATGRFDVGDMEVADSELEHTPVAGPGAPCICLAATDAPLRFNAFMPRLLQPLFRITA